MRTRRRSGIRLTKASTPRPAASQEREESLPLRAGEVHPAAMSALAWLKGLDEDTFGVYAESFAACAASDNRLAQVCSATITSLCRGEFVGERYVLGLAWTIRSTEHDRLDQFLRENPAIQQAFEAFTATTTKGVEPVNACVGGRFTSPRIIADNHAMVGVGAHPEVVVSPVYLDKLRQAGRILNLDDLGPAPVRVRFVGYAFVGQRHWIDPTGHMKSRRPLECRRFNPDTQEVVTKHRYDCVPCFANVAAEEYAILNLINRNLVAEGRSVADAVQVVFLGDHLIEQLKDGIKTFGCVPTDPEAGFDMVFTAQVSQHGRGRHTVTLSAWMHRRDLARKLTDEELTAIKEGLFPVDQVHQAAIASRHDEIWTCFVAGLITREQALEMIAYSVDAGLLQTREADALTKAVKVTDHR